MEMETPLETWKSLQTLLETLLTQSIEFRFLSFEEKIDLVIDTLRNKALKQFLMYATNSRVTLSTVHGSKGLEWDYIILPDMESYSFPSYPGLCRVCYFRRNCKPDWGQISPDSEFAKLFIKELNVFYFGETCARKAVFFTYSDIGLKANGEPRSNKLSCFLGLDGFQIKYSGNMLK